MTPLPDEQPLSRRQLREQQRTTEPSAPAKAPSRRVSTTSPIAGGDIPDVAEAPPEPSLTTGEVAALEEAEASGRPLTRRQARDLERVRTASLSVVSTQTDSPEGGPADAAAPVDEESAAVEVAPDTAPEAPANGKPSSKTSAKKNGKRDATTHNAGKLPSFVPSSARTAAAPDVVDAEIVTDDEKNDDAEASRAAFEILTARHPESAFGPAASVQAAKSDDAGPQLSNSFGRAVLDGTAPTGAAAHVDEPFDQIIARGLEEAGSGVSTSSIILPALPNSHPLTGPLSANGNVVVTGSIDLPSGMGSNGAHPDHFDKSDIDAMFDAEDEARPATAGTPVSASKAVSTHTATRDVITPPAPARSNRLLLILAITAGVLFSAVLAVIIVGIAAGAFQSR